MKFIKKQNIIKESKELRIPLPIWELHSLFKKSGKKLFLVGGAVRDFITGEEPKDFDLATDATPNEMKSILSRYRINLQGEKFGVIVVYGLPGLSDGVEIATFREDIGKGKGTSVKIGASIEMDVKRRDLSYNGLFYDLDKKEIIDLVGGVEDLKNRVVRMIGNPVDRISEDKLRILRIFRFASRYNSEIDKDTKIAVRDNNKLTDVSQERIWEEFTKSFKQSKKFEKYLQFISEFNMWAQIFPGIDVTVDDYIETNNIVISLSQLFRENDSKMIVNKMIKDSSIPNKLSNQVSFLISLRKLNSQNVVDFLKNKNRYDISNDILTEWFDISGMTDDLHQVFINFNPSIDTREVMSDLGIKTNNKGNPKNPKDGVRVGQEIRNRIINQFKSLL